MFVKTLRLPPKKNLAIAIGVLGFGLALALFLRQERRYDMERRGDAPAAPQVLLGHSFGGLLAALDGGGVAHACGQQAHLLGPLQQGLTVVGQAITLLVAAEQGQAEGRLQPVQAPGDGGHSHAKGVGGTAQGAAAGDGQEDAGVVPEQGIVHSVSIIGR
jgi:hypothetical protein